MRFIIFILVIGAISCGGGGQDFKVIDDLPFQKAENAKEYSDLIIKSIRTNRDFPIWQEFSDNSSVNKDSLNMIVGMYSTAISGRNDWEYIDVYEDSAEKDESNGFDYAWLDPSGRLGLQIKIVPVGTKKGFDLDRIEFRSRLDVMESKSVPGGKISNYEKLEYDWDAKLRRMVEEAQK